MKPFISCSVTVVKSFALLFILLLVCGQASAKLVYDQYYPCNPKGACQAGGGIYTIDEDNPAGSTPVYIHVGGTWPGISADGSKIAFWGDGSPTDIYTMDIDGNNVVNVSNQNFNAVPGDSRPIWSPDGSEIIFTAIDNDGVSHVYRMDADGSNLRIIITPPSGTQLNTWSWPDNPSRPYIDFVMVNLVSDGVDGHIDGIASIYLTENNLVLYNSDNICDLTCREGPNDQIYQHYPEYSELGIEGYMLFAATLDTHTSSVYLSNSTPKESILDSSGPVVDFSRGVVSPAWINDGTGSQRRFAVSSGLDIYTVDKTGRTPIISLVATVGSPINSLSWTPSTQSYEPVADAGPDQQVLVAGTTVQLDGRNSYSPNGPLVQYLWTIIDKPAGSTATLSDPGAGAPTFVADVLGQYVIELVVSDKFGSSQPDQVIVSFDNLAPVADPGGNQAVTVGDNVVLDGSQSSDPNGDPLTYNWTFASLPTGSNAVLSGAGTSSANFVADLPGTYVISLVVNDGLVDSTPASVSVNATTVQDQTIATLTNSVDIINDLPAGAFKSGKQDNLTDKINAVRTMIDDAITSGGSYQNAINKLEGDVLKKVDGCAADPDNPQADNNDMIDDCEAQAVVYDLLIDALNLLKSLI